MSEPNTETLEAGADDDAPLTEADVQRAQEDDEAAEHDNGDTGAGELEPNTETETGDDNAPPESSTPTDAPPAPTPEQLERAARRLDTAVGRYFAACEAFVEATGQELYRDGVSLAGIPGFIFDPTAVPLSEEQLNAAKILAGIALEPPYSQDPQAETCATCDGWGQVRTGSKVFGKGLAQCPECRGYGFAGDRLVQLAAGNGAAALAVAPLEAGDAPVQFTEDAWGTPVGHPDFGMSPQYRQPGWAEALQAYKAGLPAPLAAVGA